MSGQDLISKRKLTAQTTAVIIILSSISDKTVILKAHIALNT